MAMVPEVAWIGVAQESNNLLNGDWGCVEN